MDKYGLERQVISHWSGDWSLETSDLHSLPYNHWNFDHIKHTNYENSEEDTGIFNLKKR